MNIIIWFFFLSLFTIQACTIKPKEPLNEDQATRYGWVIKVKPEKLEEESKDKREKPSEPVEIEPKTIEFREEEKDIEIQEEKGEQEEEPLKEIEPKTIEFREEEKDKEIEEEKGEQEEKPLEEIEQYDEDQY